MANYLLMKWVILLNYFNNKNTILFTSTFRRFLFISLFRNLLTIIIQNLFNTFGSCFESCLILNKCIIKQNKLIDNIIVQLFHTEITDLPIKTAQVNKLIDKISKDLENFVGKDIFSWFMYYYTTKLTFVLIKVSTKLEKKLDVMYFRKYKKVIDKDRYRDEDTSNTSGVNLPNNNTQFVDPSTASK